MIINLKRLSRFKNSLMICNMLCVDDSSTKMVPEPIGRFFPDQIKKSRDSKLKKMFQKWADTNEKAFRSRVNVSLHYQQYVCGGNSIQIKIKITIIDRKFQSYWNNPRKILSYLNCYSYGRVKIEQNIKIKSSFFILERSEYEPYNPLLYILLIEVILG